MNIKNKVVKITLNEKIFNMKFDFETIANLQADLKKKNLEYKISDIFSAIESQDFSIIVPLIVNCIRRMHPTVSEDMIKEYLTFDMMDNIITALVELIESSLPTTEEADKKK